MDWLPEWLSEALAWAWVPMLGAVGGLMAALHRASRGEANFWSLDTLFGIASSAILGGVSYGVLKYYGISGPLLGSGLGMIGFIGPKIITDFYDWFKSKGLRAEK